MSLNLLMLAIGAIATVSIFFLLVSKKSSAVSGADADNAGTKRWKKWMTWGLLLLLVGGAVLAVAQFLAVSALINLFSGVSTIAAPYWESAGGLLTRIWNGISSLPLSWLWDWVPTTKEEWYTLGDSVATQRTVLIIVSIFLLWIMLFRWKFLLLAVFVGAPVLWAVLSFLSYVWRTSPAGTYMYG